MSKTVPSTPRRTLLPRLLPREHGAWVQLLLPAATALASGSRGVAPWLWTLTGLAAFLAHEPVRVALGHRGARLARDLGPAARRTAVVALGTAGASALVALFLHPIAAVWLLAPLVAASVLTLVIAQRADRTLTGELVAAVCLPWVALPVAISAGVATRIALGQTAVWSLGFALLTLSVRTAKARALTQPISRILARFTRSISVVAVLLAVTLALAGVATIPEAAGLTLLALAAAAMDWQRVPMRDFWRLGVAVSVAAVATSVVLAFGAR
jgi:hypothetical protein